jgi:hypothetical protein
MASIVSSILKIFRRRKAPPLQCSVSLDPSGNPIADDPDHKHTSACFIPFEALAVAELFQSQGCAACPPALPAIHEATMSPNVLLLTYNVTLFDHLGWKDTFASSAWDARHRAYAKHWQRNSLFTPQVVVNGVVDTNAAGGKAAVTDLVASARNMHGAMDWRIYLDANDSEIRIDSDRAEIEAHDILVVVYSSMDEVVKVGKGPNKGKKIRHVNVVKNVTKIGEWYGGNSSLMLPAPKSAMKHGEEAAVLVQGGSGGPIVAAVKV